MYPKVYIYFAGSRASVPHDMFDVRTGKENSLYPFLYFQMQ